MLTKKDIFVTILFAVFLLMALGAVGSRGRRLARFVVCQGNLKLQQDAQIQFWQDNSGQMTHYSSSTMWWEPIRGYLGDYADRVRLCPEADDVVDDWSWGGIYRSWAWPVSFPESSCGSYGFNGWLYEDVYVGNIDLAKLFKHLSAVSEPEVTPVFIDAMWVDSWPMNEYGLPPDDWTDQWEPSYLPPDYPETAIQRFLMNRHDLRDNVSFVDGHVEPVHFTDLWTLYWHLGSEPNYDVVVPW